MILVESERGARVFAYAHDNRHPVHPAAAITASLFSIEQRRSLSRSRKQMGLVYTETSREIPNLELRPGSDSFHFDPPVTIYQLPIRKVYQGALDYMEIILSLPCYGSS